MTTVATEPNWDLIPASVRQQIEKEVLAPTAETLAKTEEEVSEPVAEPVAEVKEPEQQKVEVSSTPAPTDFKEVATEEMTKEQRYKIMEGMQKAAGRDVRQARAELQALRDEIEALKARAEVIPPPPEAAQPVSDPEVESRLAEAFGESNLKDMVGYLRSQGFAVTQDLGKLKDEVGSVSRTIASSAHEKFTQAMNEMTDGQWVNINTDPKFIEYMNEPEGRTGIPRIEFAKRHLSEQNAPLLAQYFVDFTTEVSGTPVKTSSTPKFDKRKLASPRATPTSAPAIDEGVKMVRISEFQAFADDVRNGKYENHLDPARHKVLQEKYFAEKARLDDAQRLGHIVKG